MYIIKLTIFQISSFYLKFYGCLVRLGDGKKIIDGKCIYMENNLFENDPHLFPSFSCFFLDKIFHAMVREYQRPKARLL